MNLINEPKPDRLAIEHSTRTTSLAELSRIPVLWGRQITLTDLVNEWAARVVQHHADSQNDAAARDPWGLDDLEGSYFVRDQLHYEFLLHNLGRSPVLDSIDSLLITFTSVSTQPSLAKLAGAEEDAGWWWARIPTRGLVRQEYEGLQRGSV